MRVPGKLLLAIILSGAIECAAENDGLFRPPVETAGRISPGGQSLVVVVNDGDHQRLETISLDDGSRREVFSTRLLPAEKVTVNGLDWVDENTLIFSVIELSTGVASLKDTRNKQHIFVLDIGESEAVLRFIESDGAVVNSLPDDENKILFARAGTTSFVYRVDTTKLNVWGKPLAKTAIVDGGQFARQNRVAEVEGVVFRWIASTDGTVRAAWRWSDDQFALLMRDGLDSDWRVARSWGKEDKKSGKRKKKSDDVEARDKDVIYVPYALIEGSDDFVVVTDDESGRNAVYRYNYETDEKSLIYQHPSAEIVNVVSNYRGTDILYVSYFEEGEIKYHYVEGAYAEVANQLQSMYPEYVANIAASDLSGDRFFVLMTSTVQPGRAFSYDLRTNVLTELFSVMPWIDELQLSRSEAGKVSSHGLDIEYYLTVPDSTSTHPLIVHPHGGPWGVRDYRAFDPIVQYLASHGLAVLQVNYRGSAGYGDEFLEQGKGEFGKRMIDDIEAAMAKAMSHPGVDPNRVCAIGHSYGGYAALMLAIRSPEKFTCVASYAGVTDLGLLVNSYDDEAADFLSEVLMGDNPNGADRYASLKSLSPVFQVEQLEAPLFLAHGNDDRRVDIEHSQRLKIRLEALGKEVEWTEYDGEGHNFSDHEAMYRYYASMVGFLERKLAGRDQP